MSGVTLPGCSQENKLLLSLAGCLLGDPGSLHQLLPGSVAADRLWVDKVGIHFLQRLLSGHAHQGSASE